MKWRVQIPAIVLLLFAPVFLHLLVRLLTYGRVLLRTAGAAFLSRVNSVNQRILLFSFSRSLIVKFHALVIKLFKSAKFKLLNGRNVHTVNKLQQHHIGLIQFMMTVCRLFNS